MDSEMISLERFGSSEIKNDLHRFWKVLLFSDGSMTINLENLTQSPVSIEIVSEKKLETDELNGCFYKDYANAIENPIIERQVLIKNEKKELLMKASSLWNIKDYERVMQEKDIAIGLNLIKNKHEYFREILHVNIRKNFHKDVTTNESKDAKFRCYFIYHSKKVMTYIEETFMPDFDKYMEFEKKF